MQFIHYKSTLQVYSINSYQNFYYKLILLIHITNLCCNLPQVYTTNPNYKFRNLYTSNLYKYTNTHQKWKCLTLAPLLILNWLQAKRRYTTVSTSFWLPRFHTIFKGKVKTLHKPSTLDVYKAIRNRFKTFWRKVLKWGLRTILILDLKPARICSINVEAIPPPMLQTQKPFRKTLTARRSHVPDKNGEIKYFAISQKSYAQLFTNFKLINQKQYLIKQTNIYRI